MLTKAQRNFVSQCFQTPWEAIVSVLITNKQGDHWEDLFDIAKKEKISDEEFKSLLKPLIEENEIDEAVKHLKLIHALYYLEQQKENLEKLGGAVELIAWQAAVLQYLSTTAEYLIEKKEDEENNSKPVKLKVKKNFEEPIEEQSLETVKVTPFQPYEIEMFLEKEKIACAAIKNPADAMRFSNDQLFSLGQQHQQFAIALCENPSLLSKLTQSQILKLAEMHAEVTVFLANYANKFNIDCEKINLLILDVHYNFLKNNESILHFLINLVTNTNQYNRLSPELKNKLLSHKDLAAYAFENPKAFNANTPLFIELVLSHIKNNHEYTSKQILTFLQHPSVYKNLTEQQLFKLFLQLADANMVEVLRYILNDQYLCQKISTQTLIQLIVNSGYYYFQANKDSFKIIKEQLEIRGFFNSIKNLLSLRSNEFLAFVNLTRNDQAIENNILDQLQKIDDHLIPDDKLGILFANFKSIRNHIIKNCPHRLSVHHVQGIDPESLTENQREQLITKLTNTNIVISLALQSSLFAKAVIATGKYADYPKPDAALKVLFNKYPDIEEYAFQTRNFDSSQYPTVMLQRETRLKINKNQKEEKEITSKKPAPKLKSKKESALIISTAAEKKSALIYDYLFKVVLQGDTGVGKSCLLLRYTDNTYTESYLSTIGLDFKIKDTQVANKTVRLQIWDTMGKGYQSGYCNGAHALIIAFDLTDKFSFNNAKRLYEKVLNASHHSPLIILVGTKCDSINKRIVSKEEVEEFTKSIDIPYFETSAKQDINITELFSEAAVKLVEKFNNKQSSNYDSKVTMFSHANGWSPKQFAEPKTFEDIKKMDAEFEKIFNLRQSKNCQFKDKISTELENLRTKALKFIKTEKEKYGDKSSKTQFLETARKLSIFQNHIYEGLGAFIKNIGRTNTLIKIDKWIKDVKSEGIPDAAITITYPNPSRKGMQNW